MEVTSTNALMLLVYPAVALLLCYLPLKFVLKQLAQFSGIKRLQL
jgi:hypothetical protein